MIANDLLHCCQFWIQVFRHYDIQKTWNTRHPEKERESQGWWGVEKETKLKRTLCEFKKVNVTTKTQQKHSLFSKRPSKNEGVLLRVTINGWTYWIDVHGWEGNPRAFYFKIIFFSELITNYWKAMLKAYPLLNVTLLWMQWLSIEKREQEETRGNRDGNENNFSINFNTGFWFC